MKNPILCEHRLLNKGIIIILLIAFIFSGLPRIPAEALDIRLPVPGVRISVSPPFDPPVLKGIKVHADNPFRFDFILDKGDDPSVIASPERAKQSQTELKAEANKLIKYFLASITVPEKDLWVNLSPYEKDRIIPKSFGLTEMGRDLLAEDYMLKQITASLIYPEEEVGKKFWKRIYEEAAKKYGTTNIPVNTFNKVWIIPEKAVVYENAKAGTAYVVESKLKVMLEEDYLSLQKHSDVGAGSQPAQERAGYEPAPTVNNLHSLASQIVREVVIPELTTEVNEGKNFSQLRQVYNSLILATWYKKKIKDSILAKVYADRNKVAGVGYDRSLITKPSTPVSLRAPEGGEAISTGTTNSKKIASLRPSDFVRNDTGGDRNDVDLIYQRYLRAFKKGVYNYIKEEQDPLTQEVIPRKYFSGGLMFGKFSTDGAMVIVSNNKIASPAMRALIANAIKKIGLVMVLASLRILSVNDVHSQTNTIGAQPSMNELLENPDTLKAIEKVFTKEFGVPDKFLAIPSEKPVTTESLKGYEIVPDAHMKLGSVILQAGDYLGLVMIPQVVSQLREDVRIVITVPNQQIARQLLNKFKQQGIKNLEQRLRFVIGVQSSSWGRDPYVVLYNSKTGQFTFLPAKGDAGTQLDHRMGRELMKYDFGWKGLVKHNIHDETLDIQGGDATADDKYVYVGEATIHASKFNLASQEVSTEEAVINKIEQFTGKEVIVLRGDVDIHNDRYHIPLGKTKYGDHTSLLADPVQALQVLSSMTPSQKQIAVNTILEYSKGMPDQFKNAVNKENLEAFFNVTPERIQEMKYSKLVQDLNKIASDLEGKGIVVKRIPGLPSGTKDVPFGIYPTNIILDNPSANDEINGVKPSVILPHYGIGLLDDTIDAVYKDLGFEIRPIIGILAGFLEGGPRCLGQTIGIPTKVLNALPVSQTPDLFLKTSPVKQENSENDSIKLPAQAKDRAMIEKGESGQFPSKAMISQQLFARLQDHIREVQAPLLEKLQQHERLSFEDAFDRFNAANSRMVADLYRLNSPPTFEQLRRLAQFNGEIMVAHVRGTSEWVIFLNMLKRKDLNITQYTRGKFKFVNKLVYADLLDIMMHNHPLGLGPYPSIGDAVAAASIGGISFIITNDGLIEYDGRGMTDLNGKYVWPDSFDGVIDPILKEHPYLDQYRRKAEFRKAIAFDFHRRLNLKVTEHSWAEMSDSVLRTGEADIASDLNDTTLPQRRLRGLVRALHAIEPNDLYFSILGYFAKNEVNPEARSLAVEYLKMWARYDYLQAQAKMANRVIGELGIDINDNGTRAMVANSGERGQSPSNMSHFAKEYELLAEKRRSENAAKGQAQTQTQTQTQTEKGIGDQAMRSDNKTQEMRELERNINGLLVKQLSAIKDQYLRFKGKSNSIDDLNRMIHEEISFAEKRHTDQTILYDKIFINYWVDLAPNDLDQEGNLINSQKKKAIRQRISQEIKSNNLSGLNLANLVAQRLGSKKHFYKKGTQPINKINDQVFNIHSTYPPILVSTVGSAVFVGVGRLGRKLTSNEARNEIRKKIKILGDVYQRNRKRIFFIPYNSPVTARSLNDYTGSLVASMEVYQKNIVDNVVIDIGSGAGELSAVALGLGAKRVILIENNEESCNLARVFLKEQGWGDGEDFKIINRDLKNIDELKALIQAAIKDLNNFQIVCIQDIGPWDIYGQAHQYGLRLMMQLKPNIALVGGYLSNYFEQPNPDMHLFEKNSYLVKDFRLEVAHMFIAERKRNMALAPAENGSGVKELHKLPKLNVIHDKGSDTAQKRNLAQKGGIDLTSQQFLQTQNSGGEIKFHIDQAMLQQLQNASGFTVGSVTIQTLKSLPEFLGLNQEPSNQSSQIKEESLVKV